MTQNKTYVSATQEFWRKYFDSSEEEQREHTYAMAVSVMWQKKELDRDGWCKVYRDRMEELTAEVGATLSSIDYEKLTPEEFKNKTDALGITDQVLEMQEIWRKVARAKAALDSMLADSENKGEQNESK